MPKDISKLVPDAALERHVGIVGKTGSGKSNTAKVLVERLLDRGDRVCVLDPTGAWWGLRSSADGSGPGYPVVVFGGVHADLPFGRNHGAALADIIGKSSTPAVIDTRLMTVGERTQFFTDFAEALLRVNSGPLTLVVDEAHLFAPQGRVNDPQSGKMVHAANNLVSLGRSIGLRIIMISQRPAKLHKDALTQIETLIAMRLIAPHDRRAVDDWIGECADPGQGKEIAGSLASLPTGTGWVWAPELGILHKVAFPLTSTFDSGSPQASGNAPVLAPIDVDEISGRLEQVAADAIANDPDRLRKRIAELERAAKTSGPSDADLAHVRQEGFDAGLQQGYLDGLVAAYMGDFGKIIPAIKELVTAFEALPGLPEMPAQVDRKDAGEPKMRRSPEKVQVIVRQPARANGSLPSGAVAMLKVACERHPVRLTWGQITTMLRRKARGGSFNTARKAILDGGYAEEDSGRVVPTDVAFSLTGTECADVAGDMLDVWLDALPSPANDMLKAIVDRGPISREDLAAHLDRAPHGGSWNTGMKTLRDNDLVSEAGGFLAPGPAIS